MVPINEWNHADAIWTIYAGLNTFVRKNTYFPREMVAIGTTLNYVLEEIYQRGKPINVSGPKLEIEHDQVAAFIPLVGFEMENVKKYYLHGTILPCAVSVMAMHGEMILSDERKENRKRFAGVPYNEQTAVLTYAVPFSVHGNFVQTIFYADFEEPRCDRDRRPLGKCFTTLKPTVRALSVVVSTPKYIERHRNMQYIYHNPHQCLRRLGSLRLQVAPRKRANGSRPPRVLGKPEAW